MPSSKLRGKVLLRIAGCQRHYALYLATKRIVAAFGDELAPYEIKPGTIRFPPSEPVPEKLIEQIMDLQAN